MSLETSPCWGPAFFVSVIGAVQHPRLADGATKGRLNGSGSRGRAVMVTLSINGQEVSPSDEAAINQQVNRRRNDGARICVRVEIKGEGMHVVLGTPDCDARGGGRQANEREQRILDLWRQLGLADGHFAGGQVIAFLRQVQRFA